MSLAIFDLDNTLIAGDSDHLWGEFLIEQGKVDQEHYRERNDYFYREYKKGTLDIHAYLEFALTPLRVFSREELNSLHQAFMEHKILPLMLPKAQALIEEHRQKGDTLLIITATNRFITAPIAKLLGIPHLLATEPEEIDGCYTGRATGIPCFQDGKVHRLREWLALMGQDLSTSYFYSDSVNDIPLLKEVSHPVAVDPDPLLRAYAEENRIPIISLR
ncbi:HAD family hydrolase [Saccharophagus sp. K07]|uniref:histidinol-phosphatase n=1 Tax=Saccharophagus sp. K07 TaxID=2283636 RepID=UPI00165251EC|nr:HAD family hydrolase [Saccharophagus sp. K07]MBC6906450.1 HAD family hydrolase [Saccharophagus sp. K07]